MQNVSSETYLKALSAFSVSNLVRPYKRDVGLYLLYMQCTGHLGKEIDFSVDFITSDKYSVNANEKLSSLSREDLFNLYEQFHSVTAEDSFNLNYHIRARQWIKGVLQFIGNGLGIPDDMLVLHADDLYNDKECASCGKQIK